MTDNNNYPSQRGQEVAFTLLGRHRAMGRSSYLVRCQCGHEQRVFIWSWAGHGKAICKGCGGKWPSRYISKGGGA